MISVIPVSDRGYTLIKVKNGWILSCEERGAYVCDTLGEALDQLNAEEEKFPVGG